MTVPTDPLYARQWHFDTLGNGRGRGLLERVWNDYTGAGVRIGVYDSGVELTHPDLDGTYDPSRNLVIGGTTYTGGARFNVAHGTGVAGIMTAENDGAGTVGISWGARFTSVDVFNPANPYSVSTDLAYLFPAIRWGAQFDVTNNSWGYTNKYAAPQSLAVPSNPIVALLDAFAYAAESGRGGLGTVAVNSAANDDTDAGGLALNVSRHTITVGAILETGIAARYSNYGACLLVSAPGGDLVIDYFGLNLNTQDGTRTILGTDLSGALGFNDAAPDVNQGTPGGYTLVPSDYCDMWGGTSFASPMVAGVVALMLDANPNLGWRDVQDLIARSAFHTGAAIGGAPLANENGRWFVNKAADWNGGGMHFSIDYGYGAVDPFGAVRLAEAAGLIAAAAKTSANELVWSSNAQTLNAAIADNAASGYSLNFVIPYEFALEHIDLSLDFAHARYTDLRIALISPQGTEVQVYDGLASDPSTLGIGLDWMWGVEAFRGERAVGTWTVRIDDVVPGVAGVLKEMTIEAYGGAASAGDVFYFTDEFAQMRALAPARGTLSDGDGGIDWLNAAALSGDATINLNPGQTSAIDGAALTIAAGTIIEHAIAGDGNDTIAGNTAANKLYGMRGNDTLEGGAGADTLTGGTGDDAYVNPAGDSVIEVAGSGGGVNDIVFSNVSYNLASAPNVEDVTLTGAAKINAVGGTANNRLTGNGNINILNGGGANDFLAGMGGNDQLNGGQGNDIYVNPDAGDIIGEVAGVAGGTHDRIQTLFSFDLNTVVNIEDVTLVGGNPTAATGNGGANILIGGTGANTLNGGGGNDTITGGAGDDIMNGGAGADLFKFAVAGTGNDTIAGFETALDHFNLAGGLFSARVESAGNTTLTHAGGTILVTGIVGLSVTQWNALVVTTGRTHDDASSRLAAVHDHAFHPPAPIGHFGAADFLFA